jgi:hypothetical protein
MKQPLPKIHHAKPIFLFLFLSIFLTLQSYAANTIPGVIQAEDYDNGGQDVAYHDNTPTNTGGATYRNDMVDIETCSEGGYDVGYIEAGEWLKYTVTVQQTGYYDIYLRTSSGATTGSLHFEWDGSNLTGTAMIPSTNGWQSWGTVKLSYVYLTQGTHTMRVLFDGGSFNFNSMTFGLNNNASTSSSGYLKVNGKNIVNNNGTFQMKGVNTGGWEVMEGYIMHTPYGAPNNMGSQHGILNGISKLAGASTASSFHDNWLSNYITKSDIDSIAKWGFNSIRLPMHYELFTDSVNVDSYTETGFKLIDTMLSWCRANNLYLILDMHAAPGRQSNDNPADCGPDRTSQLWTSSFYQNKTVRLWQMIAQRYANEPYIGGYDLINETAYSFPNGDQTPMRTLFIQITNAIRLVDKNHLLWIEGNWYATSFGALTPTWDNNMAYSFHYYNGDHSQGSIQGYLDLMNNNNVPIWAGEFGENSNEWMAGTISLFNSFGISWSVWTYKKLSTISAPVSSDIPNSYQTLLNYWNNGGAAPSAAATQTGLNDIVNSGKLTNSHPLKDFLDGIFRQPYTNNSIPYKKLSVPGTVKAVDYDMGRLNAAYYDADYQNTGNGFYNQGWTYRNDGTDIEWSTAENDFAIGWTSNNEWTNYTVNVASSGNYTVSMRNAGYGGTVSIKVDGTTILNTITIPSTNGWDTWQTTNLGTISLTGGTHTIQLFINTAGFNIRYLNFTTPLSVAITAPANNSSYTAPTNIAISTSATSTGTVTKVELYNGATLLTTLTASPYNYTWSNVAVGTYTLTAKAYDNNSNTATSASVVVKVNVAQGPYGGTAWPIPGKIEAEAYDVGGAGVAYNDSDVGNNGGQYRSDDVDIEACTDTGTGYDVGWTAAGEWMEYTVNVANTGLYNFQARVSSPNSAKTFHMEMDGQNVTGTISVPNTGGWQTWATATVNNVSLTKGQHVMRVHFDTDGFNYNYVNVVAANQAPTISITAPSNNAVVAAPATITITTNATDSDGTVSKVEFFNGTSSLGVVSTSPFNFTWNNVAAGTYTLTAVATDNGGLSTTSSAITVIVDAPPTVSITSPANNATFTAPASVTINATASDADGTVGKVDFYNGATLLNSDNSSPYSFNWTSVAAGTYTLTAKATDDKGISTTSAPITIVVNNNPTISFNNITKTYGDPSFVVSATSNSPGSITYTITAGTQYASITSGGQVTIKGAGTVTIQASQAAATGYNAGTATATLTINKATLTATADNQSRVYNTTNPTLTISYLGFAYGETASVLTTSPTASTTATQTSNVGTYPITLTGGTAVNYTITFVNGTLTITQATPTVTYTGATSGTQGTSIALSANSNSNGAISYSVNNGTCSASVSGSNLNLTSAGTVTVTVTVAATTNYATASTTVTIIINNPQNQNPTISFTNITKTYGDPSFAVSATSNSPGAITYSITAGTQYATITSGGQVTIKGAGTVTIQATQAPSTGYNAGTATATLTINKATLTATADNQSRVYNTMNQSLTISYLGFAYGETASVLTITPTASTTATQTSNVGTYPITLTGGSAANYTISLVNGTLSITKATPTLVYTGATSGSEGTSITLSSSTNSDGVVTYSEIDGTGSATISGSSLNLTSAGTVTVTVTVAATTNYNTANITQTITINAVVNQNPVITFNDITKNYGDAPFMVAASSTSPGAFTYSITAGNQFATITPQGQVTILGVGSVTIMATQADAPGYNSGIATATLTINKSNNTSLVYTGPITGIVGSDITLSASSNSTGVITYSKVSGGTGSAILNGTTLSLSGGGTITIQISVAADQLYNAQTITQVITITQPTAVISGNAPAISIEAYPNPATDFLIVKMDGLTEAPSSIGLYDLEGKKLFSISHADLFNQNELVIPMRDFEGGMYLLKIETTDGLLVKKINK